MSPASPQEIRRKNFTVRMRGLDHDEVRFYLGKLADDLESIQAQAATLTQENQSLRAQLAEARADPKEQATDQAVSVLNQAQQLADSLIDEAMQSARDLLLTARSQQRDVMEQAKVAAKGAVTRATTIADNRTRRVPCPSIARPSLAMLVGASAACAGDHERADLGRAGPQAIASYR